MSRSKVVAASCLGAIVLAGLLWFFYRRGVALKAAATGKAYQSKGLAEWTAADVAQWDADTRLALADLSPTIPTVSQYGIMAAIDAGTFDFERGTRLGNGMWTSQAGGFSTLNLQWDLPQTGTGTPDQYGGAIVPDSTFDIDRSQLQFSWPS